MPKSVHSASARVSRTIALPFLSCNPQGDDLLSVNPGVPSEDALSLASCLLASAHTTIFSIMQSIPGPQGDLAGGAGYLIQVAKAALDSAQLGAVRAPDQGCLQRAGDVLAAALEDLVRQVESGPPEFVTGRAFAALDSWKAAKGGAQ